MPKMNEYKLILDQFFKLIRSRMTFRDENQPHATKTGWLVL